MFLVHRKKAKGQETAYDQLAAEASRLKERALSLVDKADKDLAATTAAIMHLSSEVQRLTDVKNKLAKFDINV